MIGENIKRYRLKRGLTQKQLAKKSGVSRISIGNYERGDRTPPSDILNKIAVALDVTTDDLITGGKYLCLITSSSSDDTNVETNDLMKDKIYSSSYIKSYLRNSILEEFKDKSCEENLNIKSLKISQELEKANKFQLSKALKVIIENKCSEPKYKDFIMDNEGNLKIENCNKVIDYLILQYKIYVDIISKNK